MWSILATLDDEDWIGRWALSLPHMRSVRLEGGTAAAADMIVRVTARLDAPAILIGHGQATTAVLRAAQAGAAAGVLLVAPDCDHLHVTSLQVPSVLIADHADVAGAATLAAALGGGHVDGGDLAAAARMEDWGYGRFVFNWLAQRIADAATLKARSCPTNVVPIDAGFAGRLRRA
jgi:predicted alpha/beta hydrolase family esterase